KGQRRRHNRGRRSLDGRGPREQLRRLRWRWTNYRGSRRWSGRQRKRLIRKSQEGDRLRSSGRGAGRGTRVIRARFIKGDIPRYPHPTGNRVVATITLVLRTIPKKDTLNRLSS